MTQRIEMVDHRVRAERVGRQPAQAREVHGARVDGRAIAQQLEVPRQAAHLRVEHRYDELEMPPAKERVLALIVRLLKTLTAEGYFREIPFLARTLRNGRRNIVHPHVSVTSRIFQK